MLGSANITGSKVMHFMTGNLSLPDRAPPLPGPAEQPLPGDRAEGPRALRALRPDLRHRVAATQVGSAWKKVIVLSLPNPQPGRSRVSIAAEAVGKRVVASSAADRYAARPSPACAAARSPLSER